MTSSSRSTQDNSSQDDQARDGKRESDLNFGVRHGPLLTYSTRVGWLFGAAHLLHSKIHGGEKPNESNVLLTCLILTYNMRRRLDGYLELEKIPNRVFLDVKSASTRVVVFY